MKSVLAFLAFALLSTSAIAQTSTTKYRGFDIYEVTTNGFRVAIAKPTLNGKSTFSYGPFSESATWSAGDAAGVSAGYVDAKVGALGWSSNFSLFELRKGNSVNIARLDGNATFGLTGNVYLKGGLNIAKPVITKGADAFNSGFGYQLGVGVQATRNVGFDFGYTSMNMHRKVDIYTSDFSTKIGKGDLAMNLSGFEMGVSGTF